MSAEGELDGTAENPGVRVEEVRRSGEEKMGAPLGRDTWQTDGGKRVERTRKMDEGGSRPKGVPPSLHEG